MKSRNKMARWGAAALVGLAAPAMAAQSANYSAPPGQFFNASALGSSTSYQQKGLLGGTFGPLIGGSANYQTALSNPQAGLVLGATSLTFASQSIGTTSPAQTVTLTNSSAAAINLSAFNASGDFAQGNTCNATLAVAGSCSISVTFVPTVTGARTGTLTITSDATGSPHTVNLSGTAVAASGGTPATVAPMLNLAPSWNLLGNSVNTPLTVATAFSNAAPVATVWKWVPATSKWAFYTPSMDATALAAYATGKGYDVLTTINGGEGFWVNAKAAFTVQLPTGTAISYLNFADQSTPPNNLPPGWSLIAIGDNKTPRAFATAISTTTSVAGTVPTSLATLWAWDSGSASWYFYAPSLDNSSGLAGYITSKGYRDFDTKTLDPTMGFWVNHP